jgi:pimeloyl-ACP methyl ester carboxylesterase
MLCKPKKGMWFIVIFAMLVALGVFNQSHGAESKNLTFEGMDIEIKGTAANKNALLVFIPGLNSGKETFATTCDYFQQNYQCHLIQLPGFAGLAPQKNDADFLTTRRDAVIHYLQQQVAGKVTLVGHSLGGTLSLMIALKAPELVDKLVIVDALPFYPAIQNPALTADLMRPQAEQMRTMMNNQSDADYQTNALANIRGMSNNPASMTLLSEWSKISDRSTTTQAMFELMTTDLRKDIADIHQPTLVLGAWAAYKNYGSTKESTTTIFKQQYAELPQVAISLSDTAYHFITWDDDDWVNQQISQFLKP